ncbi:MAG: aminotransferase class V-fold PLP-dependent enzyme [Verrucomicrobia bacterium]|nr:aminotransferase class V-fold PLP-dependent enzyme [Verrucomicrobiota bacterium]MDA1065044.1 aminotransferase class V-fold PLP-dependent enzyme [Verrucomicrobiota bacterium]
MISRRKLLKRLSSLPLLGGLAAGGLAPTKLLAAEKSVKRNYYEELGVRTLINAAGAYTTLTACLMPREVLEAYTEAAKDFVSLNDLHDAVGKKIAGLVGCEAAMVTAGAASAMTLATAGVLTGTDEDKAKRIPIDLSGMKNEVIVQKEHIVGYTHAVINCGIKLVVVESRKELLNAINKNTAMLYFTDVHNFDGSVQEEEFVQIGKERSVPTFNDAAAAVPPKESLSRYTDMGFDLVAISGGKGIRGPQSAGLLIGRKDLIEAARFNAPPTSDRIGRGMKVNKEEMVAMWIALERYMKHDVEKEHMFWKQQIDWLEDTLSPIDGVITENFVPQRPNNVPTLKLSWNRSKIPASGFDIQKALRDGEPSIEIARTHEDGFNITTWMLQPDQLETVGARVKAELKKAHV